MLIVDSQNNVSLIYCQTSLSRLYARHMGQLMNALPNERVSISNLRQPSNANFTVGHGCGCCFHSFIVMCFLLFLIKNNCGCSIRVYGFILTKLRK
jgi:hypothetical protein